MERSTEEQRELFLEAEIFLVAIFYLLSFSLLRILCNSI